MSSYYYLTAPSPYDMQQTVAVHRKPIAQRGYCEHGTPWIIRCALCACRDGRATERVLH